MILADTSVWIDHLRHADPQMMRLLSAGKIAMHPFVVAEIALGSLHNRGKKLGEMDEMRAVNVPELDEIRYLIESHSLHSKGIGLVDAHLIASCLMTHGIQLWTRDAALKSVATHLGISANLR